MASATKNAGSDTWVQSKAPSDQNGSDNALTVANGSTLYGSANILLKFDLSALDRTTNILSATIRLYAGANGNGHSGTKDFTISRTSEAWNASQATWTNRLTGTAWTTAGGSVDSSLTVAWAMPAVSSAYATSPDIGTIVQDAISQRSGSVEILISRDDAETTTYDEFVSIESFLGETFWPRLAYEYVAVAWCVEQAEVFPPGAVEMESFCPGGVSGEVFSPGAIESEVFCAGAVTGEVFCAGAVEAEVCA